MKRKTVGTLNGILAAVSYGTNPLFTLPIFAKGIGVNSVLFYRYLFATLIYFVWLKFVKKISLKVSKKEIFSLILLAILFSFSSLTLFDAFNYIDSGIACTLLFVYPMIVALISGFCFHEKLTKTTWVSIFLTLLGISMLYGGNSSEPLNLKGVMLVCASAILYSLYIVGVKNIKPIKRMKPNKMSFYVMLFGLFVFVFNLKFCTQLQILDNWFLWLCALCLSIFPTIISLETISISIKLVGPTTTSIVGALEPLTALFVGVLLFHEHLSMKIIFGVLLILVGVTLIVLRKNFSKAFEKKLL